MIAALHADVVRSLPIPPFVPPRALAGAHLQTLVPPYLPYGSGDLGEPIRLPIEGGALSGRLHRSGKARGVVLVLHGIVGTADEPYAVRVARRAAQRGLDAVRLSLRGAGLSHDCGHAPLYHAGLTCDLRDVVAHLLERWSAVHLVGFSLGGHLVLRALGEWGRDAPDGLASATTISPPVDLAEGATFAERPAATPYRVYIVRLLKERYLRARHAMPGHPHERVRLEAIRTIRAYDAAVVAPWFGFRDVDDYDARASAASVLDRIARPTLILHAVDDPLVPVDPVLRAATRSPYLRVHTPARGGHVGFLGARPSPGDASRFWAEERAVDLARAVQDARDA